MLLLEMRYFDNDFRVQARESMVQLKNTVKFMLNYPDKDMETHALVLQNLLDTGAMKEFFIKELALRSSLSLNSDRLWRHCPRRTAIEDLEHYLNYFKKIKLYIHTDDAFSKEWQNSERVFWNADTGEVKTF